MLPRRNCEFAAPTRSRIYHFAHLFNVCKDIRNLKQLHAQLVVNNLHKHLFLGSKLVASYSHSGSLSEGRKVFDEIPQRNNRTWNTIFSGYSKNELHSETLNLYRCMRREGLHGDSFALVFAIKACIGLSSFEAGESFHADAIKLCLEEDIYFIPNMVTLYVECDYLDQARKLFDEMPVRNSVLCGAMVQGYVKSCREWEALKLFYGMQKDGVKVEAFLVIGLLRACGSLGAGREGRSLHAYAVRMGFLNSNISTCLVDMYARCKSIGFAHEVFNQIQHKDVVAWTAMISGLLLNGEPCRALDLFRSMLIAPVNPNAITLSSVLQCSADLGALRIGKSIHTFAIRKGLRLNVILGTSLIDMYWKCGCEQYACQVFNRMPERNVCSWTAMIAGYGAHGKIHEARTVFKCMVAAGHKPNAITFVSILSLCSHSGLAEEGWSYFQSMCRDYGIAPSEEHYACMVDMLARAGQLLEAESFIENMPIEPGASVWGAILAGCMIHKNVELAERAAEKLLILEPDRVDAYVLLSNIYAATGLWDQFKKLRLALMGKMTKKTPGYSSVI